MHSTGARAAEREYLSSGDLKPRGHMIFHTGVGVGGRGLNSSWPNGACGQNIQSESPGSLTPGQGLPHHLYVPPCSRGFFPKSGAEHLRCGRHLSSFRFSVSTGSAAPSSHPPQRPSTHRSIAITGTERLTEHGLPMSNTVSDPGTTKEPARGPVMAKALLWAPELCLFP